ncbi:MAG: hypothetical protein HOQ07_03735 [Sinomonas sp.]|nr:hypothetical protein [Sinomonas sp.]
MLPAGAATGASPAAAQRAKPARGPAIASASIRTRPHPALAVLEHSMGAQHSRRHEAEGPSRHTRPHEWSDEAVSSNRDGEAREQPREGQGNYGERSRCPRRGATTAGQSDHGKGGGCEHRHAEQKRIQERPRHPAGKPAEPADSSGRVEGDRLTEHELPRCGGRIAERNPGVGEPGPGRVRRRDPEGQEEHERRRERHPQGAGAAAQRDGRSKDDDGCQREQARGTRRRTRQGKSAGGRGRPRRNAA